MAKKERLTSRRQFLRLGTAALAGGTLMPANGCRRGPADKAPGDRRLTFRTLGRTGLKLPIVSMGTNYDMGLARAALDNGIVYIHTSPGYAEGNHERLLGRIFRDRPRESFVVATSPDLPYEYLRGRGRSRGLGTQADPDLIARSLENSLENMGLDYVDIYYLGSIAIPEMVRFKPYRDVFGRLKAAGKTRFVGIITHENEPEVIRAAAAGGFWDVVVTAYNFRQSHRHQVRSAIREAAEAGLGVVAMKTQAGVYWDRLRNRKINMKAALKWVLRDQNVHTTIPAFSNISELEEDLSVMTDLSLTPGEINDLRVGSEVGLSGCFCQNCGRCLDQCPGGFDVPALMRAYMYAYGYRDLRKAGQSLDMAEASTITCAECDRCRIECALGHDVKTRILDIARLMDVPDDFRL